MKKNLNDMTLKELRELFEAAEFSKELDKKPAGDRFVSSWTEEQKEQRREEILEQRKLEEAVEQRESLKAFYQMSKQDFLEAVKPVIRKKMREYNQDWIATIVFPNEPDEEIIDVDSTLIIYVRINGKRHLRRFTVFYSAWRQDVDNYPQYNRFLQMHMEFGKLTKTAIRNFSQLEEEFDGNTISYGF